jgi:hypothetical protein
MVMSNDAQLLTALSDSRLANPIQTMVLELDEAGNRELDQLLRETMRSLRQVEIAARIRLADHQPTTVTSLSVAFAVRPR